MPNAPVVIRRKHIAEIIISMFLVMVTSVAFSVFLVNHIIASNEQAARKQGIASLTPVCQYLYATDDVYQETPPQTETGLKQAESVRNLITSFQCERFVSRGH